MKDVLGDVINRLKRGEYKNEEVCPRVFSLPIT